MSRRTIDLEARRRLSEEPTPTIAQPPAARTIMRQATGTPGRAASDEPTSSTIVVQRFGDAVNAGVSQPSTDGFLHPSVRQLEALARRSPGAPPLSQITRIVRAHPEDHEACLRAIDRLWGSRVSLQVSIAVPHLSMTGAAPAASATPAAAPEAGGESPVELGVSQDGDGGPVTGSAAIGPVTGSVTMRPSGADGAGPAVTGGELEVAGELGPRTHGSATAGLEHGEDGHTVTGAAALTHRVGDRATVGGQASVSGNASTGEVRAEGGATVRLRTSDRTVLQAQGLIDTHGNLTGRLELGVFRDRVSQLPLTDEGRRRVLSVFVQASTGALAGDEPATPSVSAGVSVAIPGT